MEKRERWSYERTFKHGSKALKWVIDGTKALAFATLLTISGGNFYNANGETLKAEENVWKVRIYSEDNNWIIEFWRIIDESLEILRTGKLWNKEKIAEEEKMSKNITFLSVIESEIVKAMSSFPEKDKGKWQELLNKIKEIKEKYNKYCKENNIK